VNHRIVSGVLALLLLLFVTAALLFALSVRPLRLDGLRVSARPAPLPHEQGGAYATCQGCHRVGGDAMAPPRTHGQFGLNTCATCHPPSLQGAGRALNRAPMAPADRSGTRPAILSPLGFPVG
jgi:hypothetical protein